MYTLLNGFYKYLTQKDEYCVVILGLDNAGKTTYLEAAKTKFTKNYKGGQQELQSLWDKYYQESHAVIYVIDSNDRERMEESKVIFDKMIKNDLLSGVPLLILANKQDLPDVMGVREIKPVFQQSGTLIGRRDCLTIPVSALTGEGIDEGIKWLVEAIKRHSIVRPPRVND
ncbi:ADP-ribosylation factor-related protein 1 isoform X2 [Glossina fuscipes]|uniref:ADP-ribosylation factor-related protein 1 isoform X2 n=1 Tax=Glossina fuscipes TaxID=7396 RepID=A0A9C6DR27_9MUSC|nr:ADP-ribosylation factor-related protein 1 isoform X2 [Glossina fuscipes]